MATSHTKRRGLSLLELVLALSLAVVVLGLATMAIRFQLGTFEQRRDRVEQGVLARAILRHIADDLRSAVAFRPIELQGVNEVTENATDTAAPMADASQDNMGQGTSSSPMGTTPTNGATSPMGSSTSSTGSSTETGEETATDPAASAAYTAGFYGDQYSLQFDMSRLPRLDEYSSIVVDNADEAITQVPTDIRTISYYLAGSSPITQASAALTRTTGMTTANDLSAMQNSLLAPEEKGLVRQEQDRSIASYADVAVDLSDMTQDTGEEMLAEEVTRLEFRYFDGYEWWPDWDSDVRGGLPMAVEILIGLLDRKVTEETSTTTLNTDTSKMPQELIYRLVVRIPTAEPLDPAMAGVATEEEAATESGDSTGGTSTSAPATSSPMTGGS